MTSTPSVDQTITSISPGTPEPPAPTGPARAAQPPNLRPGGHDRIAGTRHCGLTRRPFDLPAMEDPAQAPQPAPRHCSCRSSLGCPCTSIAPPRVFATNPGQGTGTHRPVVVAEGSRPALLRRPR
jgi:hypothetical protein